VKYQDYKKFVGRSTITYGKTVDDTTPPPKKK
jgi:GH24 family phage-related lysozyme (muramidase)